MPNPPQLTADIIPTGGGVRLQGISFDTSYQLTRTVVSTGQVDTIYSTTTHIPGNSIFFIDMGETFGTVNLQYLPSQNYVYTVTDSYGTVSTPSILPYNQVYAYRDELDIIFIRLLNSALDALAVGSPYPKPRVYHAMPIVGIPPLPLITINQDLIQQEFIPIGQSAPSESQQMLAMVKRIYTVTVYTTAADARDFYRTNIIGIFEALCKDPLTYLGQNVTHRFQVASSQMIAEKEDKEPGFYYCNCMLEFSGNFFIELVTPTTVFQQIALDVTGTTGNTLLNGTFNTSGV